MLGGRYQESLPIAQEAYSIARTAGQRQLEGHAATTLGTDLVYASPTGLEAGIGLVREALAIAEEVHGIDDIGRGYACLSSVLDVVDGVEEGLAAAERGRRADAGARAQRVLWGVPPDERRGFAALARTVGGGAAGLTEAAEPISRGNGRIFVNLQLAEGCTNSEGSFEAAGRVVDHASASSRAPRRRNSPDRCR